MARPDRLSRSGYGDVHAGRSGKHRHRLGRGRRYVRGDRRVAALGVEPWFKIGDRDLATHVYRTELLRQGKTLTEATHLITRALGIEATILPMTDDRFRTMVDTDQGVLEFQDYFVRRQWQPVIKRILFDGAETAQATPQVISALQQADAIIIAPSNPFVSVEPILSLTLTPEPLLQRNEAESESAPALSPPCRPSSAGRPSKARRPRCSVSWAGNHRPWPWHSIIAVWSRISCSINWTPIRKVRYNR